MFGWFRSSSQFEESTAHSRELGDLRARVTTLEGELATARRREGEATTAMSTKLANGEVIRIVAAQIDGITVMVQAIHDSSALLHDLLWLQPSASVPPLRRASPKSPRR